MNKLIQKEDVQKWVNDLDSVPTYIVDRIFDDAIDSIDEITPVLIGESVKYDLDNKKYEVIDIDYKKGENGIDYIKGKVTIKSENTKEELTVDYFDIEKERDGWLPMYKKMWVFTDDNSENWIKLNPDILAQCGFRIYEDYRYGDVYIGLDDIKEDEFLEKYFIPLYKAMKL